MRRLPRSVDYAAVAVSPILIFLMISSLASFFILLFYDGSFTDRIFYLIVMYTMGSVALARLVIEENRAYAAGYTLLLAAAMLFVATRFVGNFLVSAGLVFLIVYLADRIVHDCTLIDESLDASGEGLVDRGIDEWIGTGSDTQPTDSQPNSVKAERKKGTQPGRTVFLLALAALPLFGVGQFMLQDNPAVWFRAKLLLAIYLFSSLSLLVTTSFLNLRRYLRQRDIDMPKDVTIAWLTGGMVLVAALLMIAYLAPMPGQLVANWTPPRFGNEEQSSSRFGWGQEAAKTASSQQDAGAGNDRRPEGKDVLRDSNEGGNGESQSPDQQDSSASSASSTSASEKNKQGGSSGEPGEKGSSNEQGSQQGSGGASGEQQQGKSSSSGEQKSNANQKSQSGQSDNSDQGSSGDSKNQGADGKTSSDAKTNEGSNQQSDLESDGKSGAKRKSDSSNDQGKSSSDGASNKTDQQENSPSKRPGQSEQNGAEGRPTSSPLSGLSNILSGIASLLKWLIILVLLVVVAYYVYLIRDQLLEWWRRLFEREPNAVEKSQSSSEPEIRKPPRPFSSFSNPIGIEKDPVKIIAITFQAFEAWCREHGWDRSLEETPTEFVARVRRAMPERFDAKALFEPIEDDTRKLASTCDRVAYGNGRVTKRDLETAGRLWQYMQAHARKSVSKSN